MRLPKSLRNCSLNAVHGPDIIIITCTTSALIFTFDMSKDIVSGNDAPKEILHFDPIFRQKKFGGNFSGIQKGVTQMTSEVNARTPLEVG